MADPLAGCPRSRELIYAQYLRAEEVFRHAAGGTGEVFGYVHGVLLSLQWVCGESDATPASDRFLRFTPALLVEERAMFARRANDPQEEQAQRMHCLGGIRALDWVLGREEDPFAKLVAEAKKREAQAAQL